MLVPLIDGLDPASAPAGCRVELIGHSEQGRALQGLSVGDPGLPLVSVVAGAHPDEPAGPVAALELLRNWDADPLATQVRLAVVPVIDLDGVVAQRGWLTPWDGGIDLVRYLEHRLRRLPGADREFAWPGAPWGGCVLPECAAAADFLDRQGPAIAHLSLHGMFAALGPWYLLDRLALQDPQLWRELRDSAQRLDLPLHEFHRHGDKGFRRVGRGFCTTPSGPAMRRQFLADGDAATAAGFGYGSMDSARARARGCQAPPPLVAISEFPLLRLPEHPAEQVQRTRQELDALVAAGRHAEAAEGMLGAGAEVVPLTIQVAGMLAMLRATIRSALRRVQ